MAIAARPWRRGSDSHTHGSLAARYASVQAWRVSTRLAERVARRRALNSKPEYLGECWAGPQLHPGDVCRGPRGGAREDRPRTRESRIGLCPRNLTEALKLCSKRFAERTRERGRWRHSTLAPVVDLRAVFWGCVVFVLRRCGAAAPALSGGGLDGAAAGFGSRVHRRAAARCTHDEWLHDEVRHRKEREN